MSSLPLFLLLFLIAHTRANFFDPHADEIAAKLRVWKGLKSRNEARDFIASGLLIAEEDVYTSKFTIPMEPIMNKLNNTYSLYECLKYIKDHRGNHAVMLRVHSAYDMKNTFWTIRQINALWIWVHIVATPGPHGADPEITSAELTEMVKDFPRYFYLVLEMSTKLHKPYGYGEKDVNPFYELARQVKMAHYPKVMYLDIVHAGHTDDFPSKEENDKNVFHYVMLHEAPGTTVDMINLAGIHRIIERVGLRSIYLDVSPGLRDIIMEKYADIDAITVKPPSQAMDGQRVSQLSFLAGIVLNVLSFCLDR